MCTCVMSPACLPGPMIHPSSVTSRKVLPFVSAQRGKTKAGGGEERCSLSIVIKHDRMQFQSAASVPVESWRCLDGTLLSFCPVAINTFTDVLFLFSHSVVDRKSQRPDCGRRGSEEEEKSGRRKSRSNGEGEGADGRG